MDNRDRDYYERRRSACLTNAERARAPSIAKLHRDFAAHYANMLAGETEQRRDNA